jgi:hypothetical protein
VKRIVVRARRVLLPIALLAVALHLLKSLLPAPLPASAGGADELRATGDPARFDLVAPDGRTRGSLRLERCDPTGVARVHSRGGWVFIAAHAPDPVITEELIHDARSDFPADAPPPDSCGAPSRWPRPLVDAAAVAGLFALGAAAWRRFRVTLGVRLPHLVPIAIQFAILGYWSLYWPGVGRHAPSIVLQVALAFALDAALGFARFGSWRVGVGPIPIVLSANLFAWFDPVLSIVVVSAAIASKTLLRRGPTHVLNPSAAGLVAGGLGLLFVPGAAWEGVFHTQNLAPNMVEVILALSLFPLVRFRLALIPLGAVVATTLLRGPDFSLPGAVIMLTLFASDPATTPQTPIGRLLFGGFVGAGYTVALRVLSAYGVPDDFSKVAPVVVANVLAPAFDALGGRGQGAREMQLLAPRWAVAHAALWLLVELASLAHDKPGQFEATLAWTYGSPLVVRDADDVPRCANNPAFCRPLSFAAEMSLWASHRDAR